MTPCHPDASSSWSGLAASAVYPYPLCTPAPGRTHGTDEIKRNMASGLGTPGHRGTPLSGPRLGLAQLRELEIVRCNTLNVTMSDYLADDATQDSDPYVSRYLFCPRMAALFNCILGFRTSRIMYTASEFSWMSRLIAAAWVAGRGWVNPLKNNRNHGLRVYKLVLLRCARNVWGSPMSRVHEGSVRDNEERSGRRGVDEEC